jgi:uncharacterized membrane protein YdbT with pleckstrin-like domain
MNDYDAHESLCTPRPAWQAPSRCNRAPRAVHRSYLYPLTLIVAIVAAIGLTL